MEESSELAPKFDPESRARPHEPRLRMGDRVKPRSQSLTFSSARLVALTLLLIVGGALASCSRDSSDRATSTADDAVIAAATETGPRAKPGGVTRERLRNAAADAANWLSHGRDFSEQRFSPLDQINEQNVSDLGLAWTFDLGTTRGVQSTPIVVDGTMYVSGPFSLVYALDAKSGREVWRFDPKIKGQVARSACCSVASRGVAIYEGKVFVGALDGRLIALDAATGEPLWETQTTDIAQPYTITGAPRVFAGSVVIGNGGADLGVRGYVSAYDPDSGALVWRTYTVPGNPKDPFESKAMKVAAKTWTGEWWKYGGGGTVWDAMAYDPELELIYVGSGNGSPHARWARSPDGGDNLYLASILALNAATGELVWHFQTTPADSWDYTATQHIILADLEIEGRARKVLMQAPKNGFFFVLDRTTGEFISGDNYVSMNWATGLDETGRPIESEYADYRETLRMITPSSLGGHNWHPMSFHPGTGLVYIPALELSIPMLFDEEWEFDPGHFNFATDIDEYDFQQQGVDPKGFLLAWNPRTQEEAWRVDHSNLWNGGVLSTGGGLVFQGNSEGKLVAFRATDGQRLWESPTGTGVMAGPVSFAIEGEQHVAVAAGWGGSYPMGMGELAAQAQSKGRGRVLAYRLGANEPPPKSPPWPGPPPAPIFQVEATDSDILEGVGLYHAQCGICHGAGAVGGGSVPDLRYASEAVHQRFNQIVLEGEREPLGMPSFGDRLTTEDTRKIQAFILSAARLGSTSQPEGDANPGAGAGG